MRTLDAPADDITFRVVDGIESVCQRVRERIYFVLGEWFLAREAGTPYFYRVLGQDDYGLAERLITDTIRGVTDVTDVQDVSLVVDTVTRHAVYTARVLTIFGTVDMTAEDLPTGGVAFTVAA